MPSKTKKFEENAQLNNVWEHHQDNIKNKVLTLLKNKKPIVLELACGGGDYTVALAEKYPNKNIIGIDIQGERIWHGAKKAVENKLENAFFIRDYIDHLLEYFPENSVSEIWITFPDPYPKKRQTKKRLTSLKFLEIYKKILKPDSVIHLKTDDKNLFDYSIKGVEEFGGEIIKTHRDIYSQKVDNSLLYVQTFYEKKHIKDGKEINYLEFKIHY